MNWDIVNELANREADKYASQGGNYAKGSEKYSDRFNGFHAGYMQNAGERESLRAILKRHEKNTPVKTPSMDDLI